MANEKSAVDQMNEINRANLRPIHSLTPDAVCPAPAAPAPMMSGEEIDAVIADIREKQSKLTVSDIGRLGDIMEQRSIPAAHRTEDELSAAQRVAFQQFIEGLDAQQPEPAVEPLIVHKHTLVPERFAALSGKPKSDPFAVADPHDDKVDVLANAAADTFAAAVKASEEKQIQLLMDDLYATRARLDETEAGLKEMRAENRKLRRIVMRLLTPAKDTYMENMLISLFGEPG